ncbi:hypothetical protein POM88_018949 [Heracleum sosnowskyi]|uniref:Poly(A) RNA polymerase mitochondrial-like central palm domain-containing protein n=1 Tax=Heracleum sosnowskyi TaxID=360622 RepID=A0AAD8ISB5_9APIA|nr:hypothetical protein POM88_018949 [Heracleum sosnowskyi]
MKRKRSRSSGKRRKRPWPRQRKYRDDLERFLINKFNAVTPGPRLDGLRSALQLKLKTQIEAITPATRVIPYGSTSAGVSVKSSDIDITVIVESDKLDSIVGEVEKVLRKAGITQLKEWRVGNRCGFTGHDEHSGTDIDLSFNSESAHKDSDFIF